MVDEWDFFVLISSLHPQDVSPYPTLPISYPHQTPTTLQVYPPHSPHLPSIEPFSLQISPRHGCP